MERTRSSFAAPPPSIPSQLGSSAFSRKHWRDWRRRSEDAFTVPVHPLIKPWLPLFSMEQADRKKVKVFRRGKYSEAFKGFHAADNAKCVIKNR